MARSAARSSLAAPRAGSRSSTVPWPRPWDSGCSNGWPGLPCGRSVTASQSWPRAVTLASRPCSCATSGRRDISHAEGRIMMFLSEYRERSERLADHLPWAALVAPGVVPTQGGDRKRVLAFRGQDHDGRERWWEEGGMD